MRILLMILLLSPATSPGALRSGTDIGGGNSGDFLEGSWCHGHRERLQMYAVKAQMRLNETGEHFNANKILILGLRDTLKEVTAHHGEQSSFTRRALERGLELVGHLGMVGNPFPKERRDRLHYDTLAWYYLFMDEHIAQMDLNIGLPRMRGATFGTEAINRLERRFVSYAKAQLRWLNDVLAIEIIEQDGDWRAVPKGDTDSYLIAAQLVAEYAASDLQDSLWKHRFECATKGLEQLAAQLAEYQLGGNSLVFANEPYAVAYTYKKITRIIRQLDARDNCPGHYH